MRDMMMTVLLLTLFAGILLPITVGNTIAPDQPVVLKPKGKARPLAKHILGFNAATAFYEDLVEDAEKIAPAKDLAPATCC